VILLDGYRDTLPADPARGRVLFDGSNGGIVASFRQRGDALACESLVYLYPNTSLRGTPTLCVGRRRGGFPWSARNRRQMEIPRAEVPRGGWRRAWALFVERCRREGMRLDYRRAVAG